jgi:hypothetical protein
MTTMITADLDQARQYFAQTRSRIVDATSGLSEAQLRFKPAAGCWSIVEILEHMALAHERILARLPQLLQAPAPEPGRDSEMLDALLLEKIPDRSIKANAPDFAQPTGLLPPAESLKRIFSGYERLTEFLESTPGLREHVMDLPPLRLVTQGAHTAADCYQWALTISAHDERHVRQILELKGSPNYPA